MTEGKGVVRIAQRRSGGWGVVGEEGSKFGSDVDMSKLVAVDHNLHCTC